MSSSSEDDSLSGRLSLQMTEESSLSDATSRHHDASMDSGSSVSSASVSETSSAYSSSDELDHEDKQERKRKADATDLAEELYLTLRKRGKDGASKAVIQLIESRFNLIDKVSLEWIYSLGYIVLQISA